MNRRNLTIVAVLAAVVIIAGGAWLYNAVQGDTQAASGPITAVPLELSAPTAPAAAPAATEAAPAAPATEAPVATQAAVPAGELTRFQITQAESKASFTLDELLNGQPKTVIGTTDQVAGELAIAPSDLSSAKIGVITVNARTLATDSDRRDRAIKNFILSTDSFELITFTPTGITGLSGSGAPGTPYAFQIAGNLTIRDKTMPVVFEATVTAESASRLSGTATTTINRGDFGLTIPSVPMVANVSEQVKIEIAFVATAS
jgi:polyisoprenoid-binding protein YceI